MGTFLFCFAVEGENQDNFSGRRKRTILVVEEDEIVVVENEEMVVVEEKEIVVDLFGFNKDLEKISGRPAESFPSSRKFSVRPSEKFPSVRKFSDRPKIFRPPVRKSCPGFRFS